MSKLMNPIFLNAIVVLVILTSDSLAQGHPDAHGEASVQIKRSSEYQKESKEFQKRVPVTLKYESGGCEAELRLEYFQKGTDAHVKSTLSNEVCGASSGSYTLRIKFRNSKDEVEQVEFAETWSRDDRATVTSENDYFVGDDIDIIRVNTKGLSCICTEAP